MSSDAAAASSPVGGDARNRKRKRESVDEGSAANAGGSEAHDASLTAGLATAGAQDAELWSTYASVLRQPAFAGRLSAQLLTEAGASQAAADQFAQVLGSMVADSGSASAEASSSSGAAEPDAKRPRVADDGAALRATGVTLAQLSVALAQIANPDPSTLTEQTLMMLLGGSMGGMGGSAGGAGGAAGMGMGPDFVQGRDGIGRFNSKEWQPELSKYTCVYKNDGRWAVALKGFKVRFKTMLEADTGFEKIWIRLGRNPLEKVRESYQGAMPEFEGVPPVEAPGKKRVGKSDPGPTNEEVLAVINELYPPTRPAANKRASTGGGGAGALAMGSPVSLDQLTGLGGADVMSAMGALAQGSLGDAAGMARRGSAAAAKRAKSRKSGGGAGGSAAMSPGIDFSALMSGDMASLMSIPQEIWQTMLGTTAAATANAGADSALTSALVSNALMASPDMMQTYMSMLSGVAVDPALAAAAAMAPASAGSAAEAGSAGAAAADGTGTGSAEQAASSSSRGAGGV